MRYKNLQFYLGYNTSKITKIYFYVVVNGIYGNEVSHRYFSLNDKKAGIEKALQEALKLIKNTKKIC